MPVWQQSFSAPLSVVAPYCSYCVPEATALLARDRAVANALGAGTLQALMLLVECCLAVLEHAQNKAGWGFHVMAEGSIPCCFLTVQCSQPPS
jgi:hypothetical protein